MATFSSRNYPSGVKQPINPGMSFDSFNSARRTLEGYEAMSMIGKGQIQDVERDVMGQIYLIDRIFGVAA